MLKQLLVRLAPFGPCATLDLALADPPLLCGCQLERDYVCIDCRN